MEDIEKACGKKTRRVDATSVHWKVGQQEKGSGNRTINGQRGIRGELRQEGEEKVKDCRKQEICDEETDSENERKLLDK